MTSKLMGKLKETLGNDTRPAIPLARPEAASGSAPREIQSSPRVQFKGSSSTSTSPSTGASPPAKHDVLDAAHSPPSVLSQHLGPPTIEHKYPRDSKWRRHSISAQEQHYLR
ncbi:xylitol dehydrogenase [Metarhizium brunneum]